MARIAVIFVLCTASHAYSAEITLPYRETKTTDVSSNGRINTTIEIDESGSGEVRIDFKADARDVRAWITVSITDEDGKNAFSRTRSYRAGNGVKRRWRIRIKPGKNYTLDFRQSENQWRATLPNTEPGPIADPTKASHVILLPGIGGDNKDLRKVRDWLTEKDLSVTIWDWQEFKIKPPKIQNQIELNEMTNEIARRFATQFSIWRRQHASTKVYLAGMSGGAMILAASCEQKDDSGNYYIRNKSIEKVIFLSGALEIFWGLEDVARCAKGIYNYCSGGDDKLTVSRPKITLFGVPFRLNILIYYPAAGRFGYNPKCDDYDYITNQLFWLNPKDRDTRFQGKKTKNKGGHLDPGCLGEDYFKEFILPLFLGGDQLLPKAVPPKFEGWRKEFHPRYSQDQRKFIDVD